MPIQTVRLSPVTLQIPNSKIREIAAMLPQIKNPISLYFGESNLPTPQFIRQAAIDAINDGQTFYTPTAGYLELRQAIALQMEKLHGTRVNPETQVTVTDGGVLAAALALRILLDPGDEAILVSPVWPYLQSNMLACRAVAREVPLLETSSGYRLDVAAIERAISDKTRALVVNSPNNPTGWVITPEEQKQVWRLCLNRNVVLVSDEVYERLYYREQGKTAPSFLDIVDDWDHLIVLQSFSKTYSMTGWRLGFALAGERATAAMVRLSEFTTTCASSISQRAGLVALREGETFVKETVAHYRGNRDLCCELAARLPHVTFLRPEGSFYLLLKIDGLRDSLSFAKELFRKTGVGMSPGSGFGEGGEGSIRLCFAAEPDLLREAFGRLQPYMENYKPGSI